MMKNIKLLSQPSERGSHNYAFIDRIFYDHIGQTLPVLEVVMPTMQAQAHLYPYLLLLDELDDDSWIALNETIAGQIALSEPLLCSVFFTSRLLPKALCQILAERLIRRYDDKYYVLRYYDPRVMTHLLWMFPDEEWQAFELETKCSSWSIYLNGGWHSFEIGSDENGVGANTVRINKETLLNIGDINCVLSALPKETQLEDHIRLSQKVNGYLITAKDRYGFVNPTDRIAFALHCATVGERFDETPFMTRAISNARQENIGYAIFTGNFSPLDWLLIKDQLVHECVKERV
ncbi:DUF4123 domain-containing protein [Limnobaculum parvum]|nr:DUF4123 domain-containing protein [Limnobaculum parvum]